MDTLLYLTIVSDLALDCGNLYIQILLFSKSTSGLILGQLKKNVPTVFSALTLTSHQRERSTAGGQVQCIYIAAFVIN